MVYPYSTHEIPLTSLDIRLFLVVQSAACGGVLVAVVLRQPLGAAHGAAPEAAYVQLERLRKVLGGQDGVEGDTPGG